MQIYFKKKRQHNLFYDNFDNLVKYMSVNNDNNK